VKGRPERTLIGREEKNKRNPIVAQRFGGGKKAAGNKRKGGRNKKRRLKRVTSNEEKKGGLRKGYSSDRVAKDGRLVDGAHPNEL